MSQFRFWRSIAGYRPVIPIRLSSHTSLHMMSNLLDCLILLHLLVARWMGKQKYGNKRCILAFWVKIDWPTRKKRVRSRFLPLRRPHFLLIFGSAFFLIMCMHTRTYFYSRCGGIYPSILIFVGIKDRSGIELFEEKTHLLGMQMHFQSPTHQN